MVKRRWALLESNPPRNNQTRELIENLGEARSSDIIALMAEARRRARERGIDLEHEVQMVGPIWLPPVGSLPAEIAGRRFAMLIPGSSPHHPAKRWPARRYGELACRLNRAGYLPVVVGLVASIGGILLGMLLAIGLKALIGALGLKLPTDFAGNAAYSVALLWAAQGEKGRARDELMKLVVEQTPLGRLGTPEEIASVIRFLLSEESSFMTGHTLAASGGRIMLP